MSISIAWLLDELGNKLFSWSTTKAVMDYDRGGENGQTLQKTLKDIESSSGDMKKDIFATNGKPGVVDKAQYAENGINVYIHSKEGKIHNFQGEGSNGKALLIADFEEGDSITINGLPVTAYMGSEEAISSMVGSEWNGKWITFIFDGETLNFKGGGELSAADKANLIPDNIREGVKLFEGTSKQIVGTLKPKEILSVSSGQALGSTASRVFAYMDDSEMECLTDGFNVYWYDVEKNGFCGSIPAQECEFLMRFSGTVDIQWYLIWAQNQSSTVTVKKNGEVVVNENRSIYSPAGTQSGYLSESGNEFISVIKGDVVSVSIGNAVAGNSVSLFKTEVSDVYYEEVDFYKNGEFEEKIAGITIPTQVSVVGFSTSNSEDGFSFSGRLNNGGGAGYVLESSGTIDVTDLSKVEVVFESIAPGASDLYKWNWVGLSATKKNGWYGDGATVDAASLMKASLPRKAVVLDVSKLTGEKIFVVQIYGRNEQTSGIIKSIKGYKNLV